MLGECCKFNASTVDTINFNDGSVLLHHTVFKRHVVPMKEKGVEKTGIPLEDLIPDELKMVEDQATWAAKEVTTEEYMVCLCLLLVDDKRCGLIKTQLDKKV